MDLSIPTSLTQLTSIAARKTFIDIADEMHNDSEIDQLLGIPDNIPLAIQLVASIAASEGCEATLKHWKLYYATAQYYLDSAESDHWEAWPSRNGIGVITLELYSWPRKPTELAVHWGTSGVI
ncbi:hypothetical protein B0H14DRAFT_2617774 [Mycena olivaceomarginata]|nr:hypothetical protein B0H14DRAFT_2617774 [Mycena olivaceomarginata]